MKNEKKTGKDVVALPASTPMQVLTNAVQNGADPVVLAQLLTLQKEWETNEARKVFNTALAEAKSEMPAIIKNREVDFTGQKGRTHYKYEDLAGVIGQVEPVLAQHGLMQRFRTENDAKAGIVTVTCILAHASGHSEESSLSGGIDLSGNKNAIQAIGSTVTYLQRYTLKAILGLAASVDDDAQSVSNVKPEVKAPIAPKAVEVPESDPETGETGPRELTPPASLGSGPSDGEPVTNWIGYGSMVLAAVKTCKDKKDVEAWIVPNAKHLVQMKEAAPRVLTRLISAIGCKDISQSGGVKW